MIVSKPVFIALIWIPPTYFLKVSTFLCTVSLQQSYLSTIPHRISYQQFRLLSPAVPFLTTVYTTLRNLLCIFLAIPVYVSCEHQAFQALLSHYMAQKFLLILPDSNYKTFVSIFNMFQYPTCLHFLYNVYRETLCRITCQYYNAVKRSYSDFFVFS